MNEEINKIISPDGLIEICEMPLEKLAGRVKIKMSSHLIHPDLTQMNKNGLCWLEDYTLNNIESAKSMDYVVSWIDEEKQIPSGHGDLMFDDEGNVIFENSVVVGSVKDAFVDDIEINGETKRMMITEGYINSQRYGLFVDWLKSEIANGKVHGSVEICGKGDSKKIEYLNGNKNPDGTLKTPRVPTIFDFSGLAILSSLENPADENSIVFEINTKKKEGENLANKNEIIEVNELDINDIASLVENAFNKKFNEGKDDYKYFYIHKFYPTNSTFVMKTYYSVGEYYKSSYSVENSKLKIGEIVKVEEDWKPTEDIQSVEVNTPLINILKNQNKEVKKKMEEKVVLELNQKIEEKVNEINTLNKDIETKATEINSLNTKVSDLETKVEELSSTVVEVNKSLESEKTEKEKLEVEVNSLKEYKETKETEVKKAEINAYFETEIPKNGFEDAEINTLKEYVEKCDLDGLKNAEKELVFKKFKEAKENEVNVEVNSNSFISTKKVDNAKVKNGTIPTFFN